MPRLAPWHKDFPGQLAGSVYAAPSSDRTSAARALVQANQGVHVDMMTDADGLPAGVSLAELQEISEHVAPASIGVHLIGSADFVDDVLPEVLALRPGTVFLPWASFDQRRVDAIRASGAAAWIALWNEWDGFGTPPWRVGPDGVLVMLIEPGTQNSAGLHRLGVVAECATRLPVAVDGGITEDIAALCVTAGAQSMVVGRALLTSKERTT